MATFTEETLDKQAHDKQADLAGPGIGNYTELERVLPNDYRSLLDRRDTQKAVFQVKRYIEDNLCQALNLAMVEVPLIVDVESGVNDMLDRDGSRTPVSFHISNDRGVHPIDAQVVQAATKWKRIALKQFALQARRRHLHGYARSAQGLFPRSRPLGLCRPVGLGALITPEQRNVAFLKDVVRKIWKVLVGAEKFAQDLFPALHIRVSRTCPRN